MLGTGLQIHRRSSGFSQANLVDALKAIMVDTRFLWMPNPLDTTTNKTLETPTGRTVTYDGSVASRLSKLGNGWVQSFNATQWGTAPDTNDMSFGNGTVDTPFSGVAFINVTDTAVGRRIITKMNVGTGNGEWSWGLNSSDGLSLLAHDQSAAATTQRASDSPITQGSWRSFGFTYNSTGGATNMNGGSLYQDGVVIPSTAFNNATYVAMESLAAPVEIGSETAHTLVLFSGSMALIALCAKSLSAPEHATIHTLVKRYFNLP